MKEQHVLLTGSSGNLGRAVTERLLEEGYRLSAIVSPGSEDFLTADRLITYPADLLDAQKSEQVVSGITGSYGPVHAAVLMVGGFQTGDLRDTSMEDITEMLDLNFRTAYNVARPVYLHMEEMKSGGQLIFIGARPAMHPEQAKDMLAYAFSKSLIFRLSEVVNAAGRAFGISSSVIVPGIIDTPQNRQNMHGADFSLWVTPGEIAGLIAHLVTPAGRKIREGVFKVYGGS